MSKVKIYATNWFKEHDDVPTAISKLRTRYIYIEVIEHDCKAELTSMDVPIEEPMRQIKQRAKSWDWKKYVYHCVITIPDIKEFVQQRFEVHKKCKIKLLSKPKKKLKWIGNVEI